MKTAMKRQQQEARKKAMLNRYTKIKFLFVLLLFSNIPTFAQNQIVGKWMSADQEAITEIQEQTGKYNGKIKWLKKPNDKNNVPFTDTENPDKNLRTKPLIGLSILKHFVYKNNEWKNGEIYDPTNGKTYSCTMWLKDNNTLKIRGFWGPFYQTQIWTRTK